MKGGVRSRRGSQIIEATLVMPLTVFIIIALIGLMVTFYKGLTEQVSDHNVARQKLYESKETTTIRLKDRLHDGLTGIGQTGDGLSEGEGNEGKE